MEQSRASPVQLHLQELARPPLVSYEVIINSIAATKTRKGLEVYARLDENEYPKVDVSDAELAAVNISRDTFHPEWNYSISPSSTN